MAVTYEAIATQTLGSSNSTVQFTSISQAYTDLILIWSPTGSSTGLNVYSRVGNGLVDSGNNYSWTFIRGNGSAATSNRGTSSSYWNWLNMGVHDTIPNTYIYQFINYSNTSTNKTVIARLNEEQSGSGFVAAAVGLWSSTSAINVISLQTTTGTFDAGSTFTLYGIKAA
jgi:hypothetical protein